MARGPRRSEGDVDAADEVPHRWLGKEVRRREVVLAGFVELRIHALVVRPGGEVTTCDAETKCRSTELPRPLVRGHVRNRHLSELSEASVFDVAGLRAFQVRRGGRRAARTAGRAAGSSRRLTACRRDRGTAVLGTPPPLRGSLRSCR